MLQSRLTFQIISLILMKVSFNIKHLVHEIIIRLKTLNQKHCIDKFDKIVRGGINKVQKLHIPILASILLRYVYYLVLSSKYQFQFSLSSLLFASNANKNSF